MIDRGILTAVLLVVAFYLYKLLRVGKRESFLPDGPKTKPIVGNALDIPSRYSFLHFTELSVRCTRNSLFSSTKSPVTAKIWSHLQP